MSEETITKSVSLLFSQGGRQEDNAVRSDITLVAGTSHVERFPVDTLILNIASPWFERLVSTQSDGEVHIHDVHPMIMRKILRYLYTDDLDANGAPEAMEIFSEAAKFELPHLQSLCSKYLNEYSVTSHNASQLFEMSYESGFPNILSKSAEVLFKKTNEFLKDDGLSSASQIVVEKIIEQAFSVNEAVLISRVLKWCSDECRNMDVRQIRERFLPYMRLFCLSNEEIADIIIPSNLLTAEEIVALYSNKNASENNKLCMPLNFSSEGGRKPQYLPLNFHNRSSKPEKLLSGNDIFVIVFTMQRDCFIEGVALPVLINPGYQLPVKFQVSLTDLNSGIKYKVPSAQRCNVSSVDDSIVKFYLTCPLYVRKKIPMKLKIKNLTSPEEFCPVLIDPSLAPDERQFKSFILNTVNRKGEFEWMGKPIAYLPDANLRGFQISALLLLF